MFTVFGPFDIHGVVIRWILVLVLAQRTLRVCSLGCEFFQRSVPKFSIALISGLPFAMATFP